MLRVSVCVCVCRAVKRFLLFRSVFVPAFVASQRGGVGSCTWGKLRTIWPGIGLVHDAVEHVFFSPPVVV